MVTFLHAVRTPVALAMLLVAAVVAPGSGAAAPARRRPRLRVWTRHALTSPARYATFAVGDTHGDIAQTRRWLTGAKLTTARGRWAGNNARLVFVGDLVNKGRRSLEVLRYARSLAAQAKRAGGRVHVLLGNHEPLLVAAALATRKLTPSERRRMALSWHALRPLRQREPELFRALAFADGTVRGALALAPEFGYDAPLSKHQRALLESAAAPMRASLAIMRRHRAGSLWACFAGNLGRYEDALALARDDSLLAWVQRRPVMGTLAGDLLIHSDAPDAYRALGATVLGANRRAGRLMRSQSGAFKLFDLLTDRGGLDKSADVAALLARYGGGRVIHGHTPHDGPGPQVSARRKRLNIDASLSDAFGGDARRGLVIQARRPR